MSIDSANQWTFVIDERTRILFVDDDMILAEFAKVHLATPSTTVDAVSNGADAWERLNAERYDIVLLDIEMPRLDGFALLEKLRADARFTQLPVVMLTGREDIASIDRAFQLGANSFVTKPINWRQLSYAIRYVLRSTRLESELLRERKRSEELLALSNNLLSLIRLEARTPLSAIIGFCDCIGQQIDGPVPDSYLRYAGQIDAAARQLQGSLMDLIQYAQLASGAAALSEDEYAAAKLLDAAVAGLTVAPDRSLLVKKPNEAFYLQCDLMWLSRAIGHLLEVALETSAHVELSISPTGEGATTVTVVAPQTDLSPARTTSLESVRHSMGVGVAFARCVVELHGGTLTTADSPQGGVVTTILIPKRVAHVKRAPKIEAA